MIIALERIENEKNLLKFYRSEHSFLSSNFFALEIRYILIND